MKSVYVKVCFGAVFVLVQVDHEHVSIEQIINFESLCLGTRIVYLSLERDPDRVRKPIVSFRFVSKKHLCTIHS